MCRTACALARDSEHEFFRTLAPTLAFAYNRFFTYIKGSFSVVFSRGVMIFNRHVFRFTCREVY